MISRTDPHVGQERACQGAPSKMRQNRLSATAPFFSVRNAAFAGRPFRVVVTCAYQFVVFAGAYVGTPGEYSQDVFGWQIGHDDSARYCACHSPNVWSQGLPTRCKQSGGTVGPGSGDATHVTL
ncbi:hypothetical protein METBIDRAFT_205607 [Metschnikowia bicuspidata var. bicuspidata NRRL YB-4993]|uniref:Uncharacterized protein n=1 Tax=Metschnikowia bicuspidata var. bicuspidata NRRL YB-4993 TaxID=869754 RepID=A0A1A0HA53_9ASCO|nr:hypothetical protein METBIDRAFT_205607 [Metschnikowia bicuspidata var. bicuspidata NRRL YB-4993]OBA20757.1 hypothetical protein METBIDRAFT_205607 [Metschnikowia bicuspidata var. bicuspidata NRRL YB-4993]